ncbi:hypothetical protein, partial [Burkholderia thailandensis]|uniref:hypothetical protein n=1 Tax=Burkholderia thailandensis TaxID=57975 RepID=UPI0016524E96
ACGSRIIVAMPAKRGIALPLCGWKNWSDIVFPLFISSAPYHAETATDWVVRRQNGGLNHEDRTFTLMNIDASAALAVERTCSAP